MDLKSLSSTLLYYPIHHYYIWTPVFLILEAESIKYNLNLALKAQDIKGYKRYIPTITKWTDLCLSETWTLPTSALCHAYFLTSLQKQKETTSRNIEWSTLLGWGRRKGRGKRKGKTSRNLQNHISEEEEKWFQIFVQCRWTGETR